MTWLQNGENLFLFWSEPDIASLARSVADEILQPAPVKTPIAPIIAPLSREIRKKRRTLPPNQLSNP